MKITVSQGSTRLAVMLAFIVAGCANTTATAPAGSNVNATDLAFVTNLYNVVDFDREVIGEVLPKNPDPRIAALGREFLVEGNNLEAQVSPIAAREGILPPEGQRFTQRADLQARIASVTGNSPIDYDQEFLADELYSHEQALESARTRSQQPGANPELFAISKEGIGTLEADIAKLKSLQAQMATRPL